MSELGPGGPLLDRFFERQRREIVDRVLRERSAGRRRSSLSALAAAVLAAAVLGGLVLDRGPAGDSPLALTLWNLPTYHAVSGDDPLAAFGPWIEESDDSASGVLEAFAIPLPDSLEIDPGLPPLDGDGPLVTRPLEALRG